MLGSAHFQEMTALSASSPAHSCDLGMRGVFPSRRWMGGTLTGTQALIFDSTADFGSFFLF